MYFAYNSLLLLLTILLAPLACLLLLARRKYRVGFFKKCGLVIRPLPFSTQPLWIHAVSVGEVMAAVPLIREIKRRYPGMPIIVSTVTETGNLTAHRNLRNVDQVIFFPFDYSFIVRWVIARIRPRAFIALETEIWPNFLRELRRQRIPAMIVSGRISSRSFKNYYFFRFFFRRVLDTVDCFCMQTQRDAERIISMGAAPERVVTAGNVKFDHQVPPISDQEHGSICGALHLRERQSVFIAGSTHRGEEEIVIEVFKAVKRKFPDTVLIIAPRHPERFDEVAALLRQTGLPWVRKTLLAASSNSPAHDIILLDTIGELAKVYSLGTVIFIGGSLVPVGGHNVLEPAVFKKPVLFGGFMGNFTEIAKILKRRNAALQVHDRAEFTAQLLALLEDPGLRDRIGEAAFEVIEENTGAVRKSVDELDRLLGKGKQC